MENKTAKEILESTIQFRQTISLGNYSCVNIPYENALKAVNELSLQCAEKQKELQEYTIAYNRECERNDQQAKEIERLKGILETIRDCDVRDERFGWSELCFHLQKIAEEALKPSHP